MGQLGDHNELLTCLAVPAVLSVLHNAPSLPICLLHQALSIVHGPLDKDAHSP